MDLCLSTLQGLVVARREVGDWVIVSQALAGKALTCLAISGEAVYAGSKDGVYRSTDRGTSWVECSDGLAIRHTRWIAAHAGQVLVGTEPAGIFVLDQGAAAWRACPEVAALRDKFHWFLPYSPEAGCVRGFAFHGTRAYAAVEVGGALVSEDSGGVWRLCGGSSGIPSFAMSSEEVFHPDVHSLEVHPTSAGMVYAPTGGGFYRTLDGGSTWKLWHRSYVRAAWVDPSDPDHIITGPADGPDRNGRIERTRNGGQTWQPASEGLDVPWRNNMVERFLQVGDDLLAVLSNGELIAAPLSSLHWQPILQDLSGITAAAVLG